MVLGQAKGTFFLLEGQMCDLLNSRNNQAQKLNREVQTPTMNLRDAMELMSTAISAKPFLFGLTWASSQEKVHLQQWYHCTLCQVRP